MSTVLSPQEMQRDVKLLRHSSLVQHHEFTSMLRAVDKHSKAEGGQYASQPPGMGGLTHPQSQKSRNLHLFYSLLLKMLVELAKNPDKQKQRCDLKRVFSWFGTNRLLFADHRETTVSVEMGQAGRQSPGLGRTPRDPRKRAPLSRPGAPGSKSPSPTGRERQAGRHASSHVQCEEENLQSSLMIKKLNDYAEMTEDYRVTVPVTVASTHGVAKSRPSSRNTATASQTSLTAAFLSRSASPSDVPVGLPPVGSSSPPGTTSPQPGPPQNRFEDEAILDSFSTVRLSSPDVRFPLDHQSPADNFKAEKYSRHALGSRQQQGSPTPPSSRRYLQHSHLRNRSPMTAQKLYGMVDTVSDRMAESTAVMESRRQQIQEFAGADTRSSVTTRKSPERQEAARTPEPAPEDPYPRDEDTLNSADADLSVQVNGASPPKVNEEEVVMNSATQDSSRPHSSAELRTVTLALPSHVKPPVKPKQLPVTTVRKPYQQRLWRQFNRPGSATARISYPDVNATHSTPNLTYNNTRKTNTKRLQPPSPPKVEAIQSLMQVTQMTRSPSAQAKTSPKTWRQQDSAMEGYFLAKKPARMVGKPKEEAPSEAEFMKLSEPMTIQDRYNVRVPSPPATSQVSLDQVNPAEVSDVHLPMSSQYSSTLTYLTTEEGPQAPPASAATFERGADTPHDIVEPTDEIVVEVSVTEVEQPPSPDHEVPTQDGGTKSTTVKKDVPRLIVSDATIDKGDEKEDSKSSSMVDIQAVGLAVKPAPQPQAGASLNVKKALQSSSCSAIPMPSKTRRKTTGGSPRPARKHGRKTTDQSTQTRRKMSPSPTRKHGTALLEPQSGASIKMGLMSRSESHIGAMQPDGLSIRKELSPVLRRRSAKAAAAAEQQRREKAAKMVQTNFRKFLAHKKRMAKHLAGHSIRAEQHWTEDQLAERREFEVKKREKVEQEQRRRAHEIARHNKFKKELKDVQAHTDIQTIFKPKLPSAKEKREAATLLQKIARGFLQRRAMQQCYLLTAEPGLPSLGALIRDCKATFTAVRAYHKPKASPHSQLTYQELREYAKTRAIFEKAFTAVASPSDKPDTVCVRQLKETFAHCDKAPSWKEMRDAAKAVLANKEATSADSTAVTKDTEEVVDDGESSVKHSDDALATDEAVEETVSSGNEEDEEGSAAVSPRPEPVVEHKSALVRLDAEKLSRADFVQLAFLIYVPRGCGVHPDDVRKSTWMNPIVNGEEASAVFDPSVIRATNLQACLDLVAKSRQERQEQGQE